MSDQNLGCCGNRSSSGARPRPLCAAPDAFSMPSARCATRTCTRLRRLRRSLHWTPHLAKGRIIASAGFQVVRYAETGRGAKTMRPLNPSVLSRHSPALSTKSCQRPPKGPTAPSRTATAPWSPIRLSALLLGLTDDPLRRRDSLSLRHSALPLC